MSIDLTKYKDKGLTGLANLGNTCYLNSTLQLLFSIQELKKYFINKNFLEELNNNLKKFVRNEEFNLDIDKCLLNKEIEDFILSDRIEGVKNFEINSTPTIIINNKKFEKSLNYKNLKNSLEKLI